MIDVIAELDADTEYQLLNDELNADEGYRRHPAPLHGGTPWPGPHEFHGTPAEYQAMRDEIDSLEFGS